MSDVDQLLSDYITEHRSGGEADPVRYLEQLEGTDREELAALIDAYLQRTPAAEWDPEAYAGSSAERTTEALAKALSGHAGLWPVVLPSLRERAKVKRAELVERLAEALGVGERREKVASYYHEMEQGSLDSEGVSPSVLEALAGIVGSSAESLKQAGRNLAEGVAFGDESADPAFTRMTKGAEGEMAAPAAAEASAGGRRGGMG